MNYPEWYEPNPKLVKLIEEAIDKPFCFLFTGKNGTGKSCMADLIYEHLSKKPVSKTNIRADHLYAKYLAANDQNGADKTAALRDIEQLPTRKLLVLDDLGLEMDTPASRKFFENLICSQHDFIQEKNQVQSIITTNLSSDQISLRYGDRVLDRLCQFYTIVKFTNNSFRLRNLRVVEV